MSRAALDVYPVKLTLGERTHLKARAVAMDDVLKVFVLDGRTPRAVESIPISGFTRKRQDYEIVTQQGDTLLLEKDGCGTCGHPFRRIKAAELMALEVQT